MVEVANVCVDEVEPLRDVMPAELPQSKPVVWSTPPTSRIHEVPVNEVTVTCPEMDVVASVEEPVTFKAATPVLVRVSVVPVAVVKFRFVSFASVLVTVVMVAVAKDWFTETDGVPVVEERTMFVPAERDWTPPFVMVQLFVVVVNWMPLPAVRAMVDVEIPPRLFTIPLLLKVDQSAEERNPAWEAVAVAIWNVHVADEEVMERPEFPLVAYVAARKRVRSAERSPPPARPVEVLMARVDETMVKPKERVGVPVAELVKIPPLPVIDWTMVEVPCMTPEELVKSSGALNAEVSARFVEVVFKWNAFVDETWVETVRFPSASILNFDEEETSKLRKSPRNPVG